MDDRETLKLRNLEVFQHHYPVLYRQLTSHSPISRLVFEDGEPDVVFDGKYFYDKQAGQFAAGQLNNFWKAPDRFFLNPPQPDQLDEHAGRFLKNTLRRAIGESIEFHATPALDKSFSLLVFGIGLGKHLDQLVERTGCHSLMLIDPNLEFLYHSLEVYDWGKLIEPIKERGGTVKFFINNVPEELSTIIIRELRFPNPCSFDGLTYFFHYINPAFTRTLSLVQSDLELVLSPLGFFFDEILMMKNAHRNLFSGQSRIYFRPEEQFLDVPVFIVGSGPSLDMDIPFIRENADKAIIISCGSAIRPLVVNGVMPDFQIEIENIFVLPIIAQVAEEHDISSVCLIAASTVERGVERYFDEIIYYFRAALSPFLVFCDSMRFCIENPNPTVVNAGLSFAQEVGFRDMYFFGTDLGVRDAEEHHAKDTYHFTVDNPILDEQVCDMPIQANFGGKLFTSKDFYMALDSMASTIKGHMRGRRYYNCSDGVFIEGAQPQMAKSLSFPEIEGGKKRAVEIIVDDFPVYIKEMFEAAWSDQRVAEEIDKFIDSFLKCLVEIPTFRDKSYLGKLMDLLPQAVDPCETASVRLEKSTVVLFRGTIFMTLLAFEYYLNRVSDKEKAARFEEIGREEIVALLEHLRRIAIEELGGLTGLAEDL